MTAKCATADRINFEFPPSLTTTLEAEASAIGARFEIRRFAWEERKEIIFAPPCSYFEMTEFRSQGRYLHPSFHELLPQGGIRFYPAGRDFHTRWHDREQNSLFCRIDVARITGMSAELADEQLPATIDVRNAYIRMLLLRSRQELLAPGFCSQIVLDSLSLALAAEMLQHFSLASPRRRARGAKLDNIYLHSLATRVREERRAPDLTQLAAEQGVSPRHFERLFREAAGEAPAAFCRRHVHMLARDLLRDRSLLVKEISYRCGFANTASFSAAFRQAEGVSPQQYRSRSTLS
jgi:AraC-like DNA-binding protein